MKKVPIFQVGGPTPAPPTPPVIKVVLLHTGAVVQDLCPMYPNISDMKFNATEVEFDPLELFVVDTPSRVYQGVISLLSISIGSIFYIGIIYYEQFGGDPMKRSIHNRMISAIAFSLFMYSNIFNLTITWRIQFGPLNEDVAMFVLVLNHFFFMLMMFNLTELMVFKVILCCFDIDF